MTEGTLAEKLRVLRARRGLTLTEAGEQIGITRHTLRNLELGGQAPHYRTLRKIAEGYGVPVEELLEEPALAGKASARPETGQPETEESERRRTGLEEIRESYRESREGLERYCSYWERRLANNDLDRESVREFLVAAGAWLPTLHELVAAEAVEVASILEVDVGSGFNDELKTKSTMYPVFGRYYDIGRKLQEVWQDRFAAAEPAEAPGAPVIDFNAARERARRALEHTA